MRKRFTAALLTGGAVTAALSLGVTSATAASGWTVKPGGAYKATGSGQVKDTKTSTVAKCTSISLSGTLKKSASSGAGLGSVTKGAFTGCTVGSIAVTVTVHGLPWKVNATKYSGGVTTGTVSGIDLVATATGCSATLDGTGAGKDNGKTGIKYTNSTGKLTLTSTGGNLHSWAVSGCLGLINNGDPQDASGTLTLSPKQTITGP